MNGYQLGITLIILLFHFPKNCQFPIFFKIKKNYVVPVTVVLVILAMKDPFFFFFCYFQ